MEDNDEEYFLGSIILTRNDSKGSLDIIDGQQRLTTLSLFLVAIRNYISKDKEKEKLRNFFGTDNELHFRQSPQDKLDFILKLQKNRQNVLMIGDGLNDAGALKQSDVGISISDNTNNFSPACDGILDSKSFYLLKDFINFSITSKKIIFSSFILSLFYNLFGLGFAFQGTLSPLIAAILMPISSISAVVFTTVLTNVIAKRRGLI